MCVILLNNGKPNKDESTLMKNLHKSYDKKIERGSTFKFMWLDAQVETKWYFNLFYYKKNAFNIF